MTRSYKPKQAQVHNALRFNFSASNNEAEYETLLAGLKLAKTMGATKLQSYTDSLLVTNQVSGTSEANDASMVA
ncbi:NYNRIN-like protein [Tanacetum coccineum]